MTYIAHKRFKGKTLSGERNIAAGTVCTLREGILYCGEEPICSATSHVAHQHFTPNDDSKGLERGKLIREIQRKLQHQDKEYQSRWDKIWADKLCQKYKRTEYGDFWLWNHDFYNAPLEDLYRIGALIGVK